MEALFDPSGCVAADEPVEVVVPAEPPAPDPVCDEPEAVVVVVAVPVPDGDGVAVPAGLWVFAWLLEFPVAWLFAVEVPCEVLELPEPVPWAPVELLLDGVVEVFAPV